MEFIISEGGKNGSVRFEKGRLVRTLKKRIGKDDVQQIPFAAITGTQHNRKTVGKNVLTLTTSSAEYEWRMKDAEGFEAALNQAMYD